MKGWAHLSRAHMVPIELQNTHGIGTPGLQSIHGNSTTRLQRHITTVPRTTENTWHQYHRTAKDSWHQYHRSGNQALLLEALWEECWGSVLFNEMILNQEVFHLQEMLSIGLLGGSQVFWGNRLYQTNPFQGSQKSSGYLWILARQ